MFLSVCYYCGVIIVYCDVGCFCIELVCVDGGYVYYKIVGRGLCL